MERRLDPYIKYTLVAAKKALEYAHVDIETLDKTRWVLVVAPRSVCS